MKPIILHEGSFTEVDLAELRTQKIWRENDIIATQLAEVYEITHTGSRLSSEFPQAQAAFVHDTLGDKPQLAGAWVYFPWSGALVHTVGADYYRQLRTNRNQNLITADEQGKIQHTSVGIVGMSVGAGMAIGLAQSGVANLKIADFDTIETANLNRLRVGIQNIGQPKAAVAAQTIYEIDPFSDVEVFADGLDATSLPGFFTTNPPQIVFDEIDDFAMKIRLRLEAKKHGVAVVMLTSLGDTVLVDIERYDQRPDQQVFNGLLGDLPDQILESKLTEPLKVKYAMQIVGVENVPTRALESLFEINKSLVGRPQLYSTIAVDGGLASLVVRRIALGQAMPAGRTRLDLTSSLGIATEDDDARRRAILSKLQKPRDGHDQ